MPTSYMYFDVETVPDELPDDLADMLLPNADNLKVSKAIKDPAKIEAKRQALLESLEEDRAAERTKWSLEPLTARIVCISMAMRKAGDDPEKIQSFVDKDEKKLMSAFSKAVWKPAQGRIVPVTFNGKSFDIRMVWMKFVQHGLPMPDLNWFPNKWNHNDHIDLRQVLTGFDDRKRGTQEQWSRRLGYPAMLALEHQGSDVGFLFNQGKFAEIAEKCEDDVRRLIYLHNKLAPYLP